MSNITHTQKITPFLWYNQQALEAANFYTTVFKNSKIVSSNAMVVVFELEGLRIMALNGGPQFKLNESFSFSINCDTQEEIDYYWQALTADGGEESRCGWLRDKFGLSWQVVPSRMGEIMNNPDKAARAMPLLMQMNKLDLQALLNA